MSLSQQSAELMKQPIAVQHITGLHSTAQHSTAQHSTAQHSTAQHSTAQHSTAQHSIAQHRHSMPRMQQTGLKAKHDALGVLCSLPGSLSQQFLRAMVARSTLASGLLC